MFCLNFEFWAALLNDRISWIMREPHRSFLTRILKFLKKKYLNLKFRQTIRALYYNILIIKTLQRQIPYFFRPARGHSHTWKLSFHWNLHLSIKGLFMSRVPLVLSKNKMMWVEQFRSARSNFQPYEMSCVGMELGQKLSCFQEILLSFSITILVSCPRNCHGPTTYQWQCTSLSLLLSPKATKSLFL